MAGLQQFTAKEIHRISQGLPPWESMGFCCGGWLQFYLFGVAKAIQDCNLDKGVKYAGCSAGSLAACGLALGGEFDLAIKYCTETCIPLAYGRYHGLFCLAEYVKGCMESHLIHKFDPELLSNGNLQVAVTKLPFFSAERVTEHRSQEDLMNTLLASCAAYPFSALARRNGSLYIDGGFTDFLPVIDENTVTVSPFYFSDSDIRPSRYVPLWWSLMPPTDPNTVEWLYNLGWEDAMKYIRSRGIPLNSKNPNLARVYAKNKHPYDTPRKVSMHRFLGYDMETLTHHTVSFVMDLGLLLMLLLIWKPLALCLIYIELWGRIVVLSVVYLFRYLLVGGARAVSQVDPTAHKAASHKLEKVLELPKHRKRKVWLRQHHNELWDCITCVYSLSLALRFISGLPSAVELRKHEILTRNSLLYRVFRHII